MNYWYITAPLMIALSFRLGKTKYQRREDGRIVRYRNELYGILSGIFAMVFMAELFLESYRGIFQFLYNHKDPEMAGLTVDFMAVLAIAGCGLFFGAICYGATYLGGKYKRKKL